MKLLHCEIEALAHEALNAACLTVQDRLHVLTGDTAGVFFAGDTRCEILRLLSQYIVQELQQEGA